jgi:hypothetical protein
MTGEIYDDESADSDVEAAMFNGVLIPALHELDLRSLHDLLEVEPPTVAQGDALKEADVSYDGLEDTNTFAQLNSATIMFMI